jgi:hypothetical protein
MINPGFHRDSNQLSYQGILKKLKRTHSKFVSLIHPQTLNQLSLPADRQTTRECIFP